MKLVDTTFLIDLLRGDPGAVEAAEALEREGGAATTSVNVYELFTGIYNVADAERRAEQAERLVGRLEVFSLDEASAKTAAAMTARQNRSKEPLDVLDTLIASTSIAHGCRTILTRNIRHFNRMPGVQAETY
ncbi:MAG: type II toxin-antitoxin system VapC family toxin [Candidatus Bathyarchaeota archaeon]